MEQLELRIENLEKVAIILLGVLNDLGTNANTNINLPMVGMDLIEHGEKLGSEMLQHPIMRSE
jgi:hypothetical protein